MKNRFIILSALSVAAIIAIWWLRQSSKQPVLPPQSSPSIFEWNKTVPQTDGSAAKEKAQPHAELGQIEKSRLAPEEIRKEFQRRTAEDRQWEWKVPISFFGKVIDQDGVPVAAATVHFSWTDLSAKGTSDAETVSDGSGSFTLRNQRGKNLGVYVTKGGYYDASRQENQTGFEFASPYEKSFYEPDEAHPMIFRLRKKGDAEPLLQHLVEVELPGDGSGRAVDLLNGRVAGTGSLQMKTWKPPLSTKPIPKPYDWRMVIEIPGGGFVENQDTFPFTAPEAGYVSSVDLHMSPDLGPQWRVGIEKTYYFRFGTPSRYGRLTLRTNGDSKVVFVDYYLNPKPGSRNLEFDPKNVAKP